MKKSTIIRILVVLVIVLVAFIAYKLLWTTVGPKVEQRVHQIGLTQNEKDANGPIPGDVMLYDEEWECCQEKDIPGYFKSLSAAEIASAERTGVFPCATFTGSFTKPNKVLTYKAEDFYQGLSYVITRYTDEIYLVGGDMPPLEGAIPSGPYIAKANPSSGKEIWRTYLDNGNASGRWIATANLNIHENGFIYFAWADNLVQVDPENGRILKTAKIPTGPTPARDANFKHLTIAPDGTLILKDQTRPTGSTLQGTIAIIKGIQEGLSQGNSNLVAFDQNTLEVLDELALPEPCPSPHIVTTYQGKIAIYFAANEFAYRYFWNPETKKLSQDESWVIKAMEEGQTTGACPSIIGEWIAIQTNGAGSEVKASSIVVVHRDDASNIRRIYPFGELKEGEMSFCPPKPITDPENSMIYSADMGISKVAGIKFNQASGEHEVKFVVDDATTSFQPLIGPADKRVLMISNAKMNVALEPFTMALFTKNYKEQMTWRDAATGRILAASDFMEPLTMGALTTPGFGGRTYFPSTEGGLYIMQVVPENLHD